MSDPYSRVYHRMADEYPNVFDDCRALGTWLRLLVLADAAYPMTPTMPGGVDRKALAILSGAGLVVVDGNRYRIKGLVQERSRRSESARIGAYVRHANAERTQSDKSANAVQTHNGRSANDMPRQDETRQDEKNIPPPPAKRGRRKDGTNPRAIGTAPRDTGTDLRSNGQSPRQDREREKRAGFTESTASILARAALLGRDNDAR